MSDSTAQIGPVIFHKPMEGQRTGHACSVACKITGVPEDMEVWIVKEPWHGSFHPDAGPMHRDGDEFKGTAYVGNVAPGADQGKIFPIHIIKCAPYSGKKYYEYIQGAHRSGNWTGIDTLYDGQILGTVTVIRDDGSN